jgi:hypothetical protein
MYTGDGVDGACVVHGDSSVAQEFAVADDKAQ